MKKILLGCITAALTVLGSSVALPQEASNSWNINLAGQGLSEKPMLRGMWIASWGKELSNRENCEEIVRTAREANLNAIFPEVRKVGDAAYLGGFEPRATNIDEEDFDPLGYLIELCHDTSDGKQYIEVHAWLVTMRMWRGRDGVEPPAGHLLAEHPETVMYNDSGATNYEGTFFADPGHPQTEEWTVKVFRDVAERYDIDGIHHDYVRYPEYEENDWGHNPVSIERFHERTGIEGAPKADDPAWRAWRREQVSAIVRRVYAEVKEVNPDCVVSAATLNWALEMDPWEWYVCSPRLKAHQDWVAFMDEGTLDMNVLMNYARERDQPKRFGDWTDLAIRQRADRWAVVGPGIYLNSIDDSLKEIWQAMLAGADGINLYSYRGTNNEKLPDETFWRRLRAEVFTQPVPVPERPWISNPTYGSVIGQVFDDNGEWVDGATVTIDGTETMLTDGTGFFAFFRRLPGRHAVTVKYDGKTRIGTAEVIAGKPVRIDFRTKQ